MEAPQPRGVVQANVYTMTAPEKNLQILHTNETTESYSTKHHIQSWPTGVDTEVLRATTPKRRRRVAPVDPCLVRPRSEMFRNGPGGPGEKDLKGRKKCEM